MNFKSLITISFLLSSLVMAQEARWERTFVTQENFRAENFDFYDSEVGYISGVIDQYFVLYRTLDGGKSWEKIRFNGVGGEDRLSFHCYVSLPEKNAIYLLAR